MEIKCVRCGKKFQIGNDRLKAIRTIQLEEMSPTDYLDFFPLIAGRCGKKGFEDKKHSFIFADEYKEQLIEVLKEYNELDKIRKEIDIEKTNIEALQAKLLDEQEEIRKKLGDIKDLSYKNDHEINELSMKLLDNEKSLEEIYKKFEDLTGTSELKVWSNVILSG